MALELLRDADDGQEHYCFARIVRARQCAAAAWGIVPTCQSTVGVLVGDAEVGCALVQRAYANLSHVGKDERAGR